MIKYGIKLKTSNGEYVWYKWWNESMDEPACIKTFESHQEADDYIDAHELPTTSIVEALVNE